MTKVTVQIPDMIVEHIDETLKELLGSSFIAHSNRELVLWALEQFAQARPSIRCAQPLGRKPVGSASDAPDEEIVIVVVIDMPDELFNRVDSMWKEFVGSTRITLSKRKLVLWALEQFVKANDQ